MTPIDAINRSHRKVRLLRYSRGRIVLATQYAPEQAMSQANILAVTDTSFDEHVIKAAGPVLLKFEADWCGPCQAMKPMIQELAQEYAGKLTIATLDVDQNGNTPYRFGVRGIPTLMLFKNGQVVAQKVGLARKPDLVSLLDKQV